jgi:hypothetical protein
LIPEELAGGYEKSKLLTLGMVLYEILTGNVHEGTVED